MVKLHSILGNLIIVGLGVAIIVMIELSIPIFTTMFNTIYGVGGV